MKTRKAVDSDEVGAVLVPAITALKRVFGILLSIPVDHHPTRSRSRFFLLCLKRPLQPVKISLPFSSSRFKPFFIPMPLTTPARQSWHRTYRDQLLTDPSLACRRIMRRKKRSIPNSSTHGSTSVPLKSVAREIKETKWPGRLSFHTVHLPSSPSSPNEAPLPPFLVLADEAHNPASAVTLGLHHPSLY